MENQSEIQISILEKKAIDFDGTEKILKLAFSSSLDKFSPECFFSELSRMEFDYFVLPVPISNILTDEDEVYNEAFLVDLRKLVQQADGGFAFRDYNPILIQPTYESDLCNFEDFTACLKHTARRLKKENALRGFIFDSSAIDSDITKGLKNEKARQFFADELLEKHPQYKFYLIESAK